MYGILVCCIDVRLSRGHRYLDFVLIIALARADHTEISVDFVVALRSPRNIVHVGELVASREKSNCTERKIKGTHSVDVQYSNIRWRHEQVLKEGSNHMPWFKLE